MPAETCCQGSSKALLLLCCASLLMAAVGCGTDEYERRLSDYTNKAQAQIAAKFNVVGAPQEVGNSGISIGIPRAFTNPPLVEGQVDARRVKPTAFTLPDRQLTYEAFIQDAAENQVPYYLYIGVTAGPLQNLATQIQNDLGKAGGKITVPWVDFKGETANGPGANWRKLRYEADLDFYSKDKAGKEQFQLVAGMNEIYLFDAGQQVLIVVWAMPTNIEPNSTVANLTPIMCGSVSVKK